MTLSRRKIEQRAFGAMLRVQAEVYQRTDGWIGHRLLGSPSLIVRTVGAKSGEPRTTVLTYAADGERYVVVASLGGSPRNPAWFHNLAAADTVEVQVARTKVTATAQPVLSGDDDYQRLWDLADRNNNGRYSGYQKKTTRRFPLVVLTPVNGGRPVG